MKVKSYYIGSPRPPFRKRWAIYVQEGNSSWPVIYLQKPDWVPEEKWETIVNSLELHLPKGYEL
jgi:hypothetical protein